MQFSNRGKDITIFAVGIHAAACSSIQSFAIQSLMLLSVFDSTTYTTVDGTAFASAEVAGIIGRALWKMGPTRPSDIVGYMLAYARQLVFDVPPDTTCVSVSP